MVDKIKVNLKRENRDRSPGKPDSKSYRDREENVGNKRPQEQQAEQTEDTEQRGRSTQREAADSDTEAKPEKDAPMEPEAEPELNGVDAQMLEMQKLMGFGSFDTTKGKKVDGSNAFGASKHKKSEYRQYMNRKKGFNRALSPTPGDKNKGSSGKKVRK